MDSQKLSVDMRNTVALIRQSCIIKERRFVQKDINKFEIHESGFKKKKKKSQSPYLHVRYKWKAQFNLIYLSYSYGTHPNHEMYCSSLYIYI